MSRKGKNGRPMKFKSVEELQEKIDAYFESCYEEVWIQDEEGEWKPVLDHDGNVKTRMIRPLTITGLAVALDTSRQTLLNYEENGQFFDTIKKAKEKIESFAEEQLFTNPRTAGVIFNMVNNYGWKNKQEHDQNVTVNSKLEDLL